jgi:hypothetical protein
LGSGGREARVHVECSRAWCLALPSLAGSGGVCVHTAVRSGFDGQVVICLSLTILDVVWRLQVDEQLSKVCRPLGLWIRTIYGGVPYERQMRDLESGFDILVGTPGQLGHTKT